MTGPQRPTRPGRRGESPASADPPTSPLPTGRELEDSTEKFRAVPNIQRAPSPADAQPTQKIPPVQAAGVDDPPTDEHPLPPRRRSTQSTVLIAVIVVAVLVGALAGAELFARLRADSLLVQVAECVVEDGASVSLGATPPFLWQYVTDHYSGISVVTDGNRVQGADGITADVTLSDVRLDETADSKGTIGSLGATLSWASTGIKETVAANLPIVGDLITAVRTDRAAGTVIMEAGGDNRVTAKPVVAEGDLNLEVLDATGPLPKDGVQTALDELTKKLNDNYPLGIRAVSVGVTDSGVVGKFSSRNASIPKDDAIPCFDRL